VEADDPKSGTHEEADRPGISRREFVGATVLSSGVLAAGIADAQTGSAERSGERSQGLVRCSLTINNQQHDLSLDPRVTLLDLLREQLHLTGSKKGCDHGQCGACTVLVNGRRINSCLALAVSYDGDKITTIEGLESGGKLHPVQTAFLENDGFQCGYCTPGQICSAVALLDEARAGAASAVTMDIARTGPADLTDDEIRERMSGNICRCGAYPNIVAAVREVSRSIA
jgi:xanthine dehydrogenase YagT iron-sulfur-binding subunit